MKNESKHPPAKVLLGNSRNGSDLAGFGLSFHNASVEKGRHRGAKTVRRARPWLANRCRVFAIID